MPVYKRLNWEDVKRCANIVAKDKPRQRVHFNIDKEYRNRSNSMTIIFKNHEIQQFLPVNNEDDECNIVNWDEYDSDFQKTLITEIPEFQNISFITNQNIKESTKDINESRRESCKTVPKQIFRYA